MKVYILIYYKIWGSQNNFFQNQLSFSIYSPFNLIFFLNFIIVFNISVNVVVFISIFILTFKLTCILNAYQKLFTQN